MRHNAAPKKRVLQRALGPVHKLVGQHNVAWPVPGLEGAHRADTDDPGRAQFLHPVKVGAMIQLGGHEAMPPSVPRQENHLTSRQRAGEKFIRRRAEGRFHLHPFLPGEPFDVIKAAPANNADAILLFHSFCGPQNTGKPARLSIPAWRLRRAR
jgi:hypothetical protein